MTELLEQRRWRWTPRVIEGEEQVPQVGCGRARPVYGAPETPIVKEAIVENVIEGLMACPRVVGREG